MNLDEAAHHPRIDVSDPDYVSADRRLPSDVIDALAADGPTEVVEHGVMPINFACPNAIVSSPGRDACRNKRCCLSVVRCHRAIITTSSHLNDNGELCGRNNFTFSCNCVRCTKS